MGEYSYILEQQGKTTSEKLAEFTAAIGWRDELATYRIAQDEYEMRTAAAAEQGISLLDEPPYTAEELAALDAESAAYYDAFAANYVATAAFPGSGSGTQSDPYIITNRTQLEAMGDDLTAYYRLANDINLGGSSSPWTPIGTISAPFSGTLDGNGYTLTGMYLSTDDSAAPLTGLFGYISSATIYDVGISGADIYQNANSEGATGCLAAQAMGSTISRVVIDQSSIVFHGSGDYSAHAGLIIGWARHAESTISDCIVSNCAVLVQSTSGPIYAIGGVVGRSGELSSFLTISNTYTQNFELQTNLPVSGSWWANSFAGIVGGLDRVSTGLTVSSCVVLGDTSLTTQTTPGRIWGIGATSGTNNYADPSVLVNGATVSGGTSSNRNGADVSPSTYHTQEFWQNTLGWDFQNVWYWDDTANLPKLRAFLQFLHGPTITSVSAIPTTGGTTTQITLSATVQDATSYQWQYSPNSGGTWQDITGATAATATWTPGAVGTYQVQLLATNSDGTTTSDPVTVTIYAAPTVTATASPTRGPLTQQITLSGSATDPASSVSPTTYQWQQASAETGPWTPIDGATTATYQYSFSGSAGTTYYRLAATGVGGTGYSNAVSYTAYDAPTAVATVTPASGRVPLQISYSVETTGNVQSYQWQVNVDGGGWQQIGTTASGTYTADTAGTYQFRAIVTGYGGSATSNTETVDATNEIIPVVSPASPYYAVRNTPVQFTVSDYDTSVEPTWTFGDGGTATGASVSHTYTTSDTYTATVTVKQLVTGATKQISVTVYVGDPPSSVVLTVPSRATYGQQVSMSATASGGAVDTWSWTFGDDTTGNGQNVTHTYSAGSSSVVTYTVTATATNNYGSATASTQIQVAIPFDASILSPLANSKNQLGTPINYQAAQPPADLAQYVTYTFDTGAGYTGNVAEITYAPQTTGEFTASLTVDNGHGYTNTTTVSYEVGDAPVITITAPAPNTAIVAGKPVTFSASVTGADSATWDFGDDTDTSTGLTVTHTYAYSVGDSVTVTATATNTYGSVSTTITLSVRHAQFRWESALGQELLFIDDYCVLWSGVDGLSGVPATGIATSNADIIGELFQRTTFGNRTFTLDVMVYGSDVVTLEANRETLISVLMPYYGLGKLYYRRFDGTEWYLNCMVQSGYPRFQNGPYPTGWPCEIGFVAFDPCWYSADEVTLTGDGTLTNPGDLPCGGIIVLGSGGATNATTNESIVPTESYDLSGITVSTIDGNKYAQDSEGNNVLYKIGVDSVFISFAPGQNVISGAQSVTIRPRRGGI